MAPASCHASLGMLATASSYAGYPRQCSDEMVRRRSRAPPPICPCRTADASTRIWPFFQQDLANIEAGLYPLPADHDGSLLTLLHRSRLFFGDLPEIHRRRESRAHNEVLAEGTRGKRPRYYLQNFHFQSGGWMTDDSASRYDTQVEVLFNGTANATRRQALPQLHEVFAGQDQRKLRLLDIGCGTGRFFDSVKVEPARGFSGAVCVAWVAGFFGPYHRQQGGPRADGTRHLCKAV